MLSSRRFFFAVMILLAFSLAGCGAGGTGGGGTGLTSVSGRVAMEDLWGQPTVPQGVVLGVAGTDRWDTMLTDADGIYKIDNIPGGDYRVVVKKVLDLPADTVFMVNPSAGWSIHLMGRIPMVAVDFTVIIMPAPPKL
ncbi:MAG: carboxypeptidase regulatory-like domain-containing protein [Firmicutes bacterium]|nr:carboxypeptidase regulatory-like domain-containing protein [Bacillota bacterium]